MVILLLSLRVFLGWFVVSGSLFKSELSLCYNIWLLAFCVIYLPLGCFPVLLWKIFVPLCVSVCFTSSFVSLLAPPYVSPVSHCLPVSSPHQPDKFGTPSRITSLKICCFYINWTQIVIYSGATIYTKRYKVYCSSQYKLHLDRGRSGVGCHFVITITMWALVGYIVKYVMIL